MKGWEKGDLPELVHRLTQRHQAILVGSQAQRYAEGLGPDPAKDWDLFVPFGAWRRAAMSIPRSAQTNGNRGWHFEKDGVVLDVWPDELARYFEEATSPDRVRAKPGPCFAVDLSTGIVFRAERLS